MEMKKYWFLALVLFSVIFFNSCTTRRLIESKGTCISCLNNKREFRGAWIQTVGQEEYQHMSVAFMKNDFIRKLDFLQSCGINAILFQVRPEADSFYRSGIEPWSRYYTGKQGQAPEGNFDLMAFLIEECHNRCMEFHAWLNPYRASAGNHLQFAPNHIYYKHPEWFISYGDRIYFDPGNPGCQHFIEKVVRDIVIRYDVDAIHMDDYFYPYPIAGQPFPDDHSFKAYGGGFSHWANKGDWRRNNVNRLIQSLKHTIILAKPWVRFGVSPFGIYRNKKNTPDGSGSNTNGLENYSELYADVLLWMKKDWVDYVIPQVYWRIGNPVADYITLVKWWNKNAFNTQVYLGQDVARTMKYNQLSKKMAYERNLPHIKGNCFWPANEILWNNKGVADLLKETYHRNPALLPAYTQLCNKTPHEISHLKAEWTPNGYFLSWNCKQNIDNPESPHYFVIYRFFHNEKINLQKPSRIVKITNKMHYMLPYNDGSTKYTYVVTSIDHFNNESRKGKSKKVKL